MQDIMKQWPILRLLPMCTTDVGLSIGFWAWDEFWGRIVTDSRNTHPCARSSIVLRSRTVLK